MKRFDPGIAFARRFIDQEMGPRLAVKAWYCDLTSRYTETANMWKWHSENDSKEAWADMVQTPKSCGFQWYRTDAVLKL